MILPVRLWHLFRILLDYRAGRDTVGILPIRLWFDSSARCNLRCPMCPNKDMPPADKGLIPLDLFTKVIDEARGATHDIYLHHRGEPLIHPDLFAMIRYARAAGIRTRFHSNGTLLTEDKAAQLLENPPDLISFSIDGFEKEAYEKVRIGATFEKTLANVMGFLDMRRRKGLRRPYVVIEKIDFVSGDRELRSRPEAIALKRRFLAAGADEVITKLEYAWAEDRAPERERPARYAKCTFPWYAAVISWDGTVTPCPQDFWCAMKMGNVRDASLREIWNGPVYRELRRKLMTAPESLALCHKCDRLCRKTVGGLPLQYMATFLVDHLVGYNRLRRMLGTAERND
jgi:radical SAM protein with 4Fe4S-binding SPASM domain